jgi:hypothetical protein
MKCDKGIFIDLKYRIILKEGSLTLPIKDLIDLQGDLEALAINPPPEISSYVQRIMYLKTRELSISDVIRSKILKDSEQIKGLFKLIELIKFEEVESSISSSNRNYGQEIFTLKKKSKEDILATAQGRARLNLFRINKDMI